MAVANDELGRKERNERPRAEDNNALPKHVAFYVSNVLAEYKTTLSEDELGKDDETARRAREIAAAIVAKPTPWTWADLYALEIAIVRLQSLERVRRRVCMLREKYRAVVGDAGYQAYLRCLDSSAARDSELPHLRAEAETLLREFHWAYSSGGTRDTLFQELRRRLVTPLILFALIVVAYTWYQVFKGNNLPGLLFVILAGVLGSFTSTLRRVQLAQAQPVSSFTSLSELGLGQSSVFIALASGAIFSVVLLLMFVGGLLQGALFPVMTTPSESDGGLTFLDFAFDTGPETGVDFAKLLVWSFISGFAERFLPDVLDKLASQGAKAAEKQGAAGNTGGPA